MPDESVRWPLWRRWCWVGLAGAACILIGPRLVEHTLPGPLRQQPPGLRDFVLDWSSARNFYTGFPIYDKQETTLLHHLQYRRKASLFFREENTHPPTSVLLVLPLGLLDYADAFLVWNLLSLSALAVSLYLIARQLPIHLSAWSCFPAVALLLACSPLHQQLVQGQWNLVLLLLLTGAWVADRSGHPCWAGVLAASAAALKLFPALLLLYFLVQRRWKSVVACTLTLVVLSGLTAAVLGVAVYRDHLLGVMPRVAVQYRSDWTNVSLRGFWCKLFDSYPLCGGTTPLWRSPLLAHLATAACSLLVLAALVRVGFRARSLNEKDRALALFFPAMLLLSPLAFDHYFLLLALPLAWLWCCLPPAGPARWAFRLFLVVLWLQPSFWWRLFLPSLRGDWMTRTASPALSLTALSLQMYALLGVFLLLLLTPAPSPGLSPQGDEQAATTVGLGSTAGLIQDDQPGGVGRQAATEA